MCGGHGDGEGATCPGICDGYVCSSASSLTLGWHGQLCGDLEMHGCLSLLPPAASTPPSARYAGVFGWPQDPFCVPNASASFYTFFDRVTQRTAYYNLTFDHELAKEEKRMTIGI